MKIIITSLLICFISLAQQDKLDIIDNKVTTIEKDSTLSTSTYDWAEISGIATDGGGRLIITHKNDIIYKIIREIGLSYGRTTTTMYLENNLPIKLIETEDNFKFNEEDSSFDYNTIHQVFKVTLYADDWNMDVLKIIKEGKRKFTEAFCGHYEYEPIIARAQKALKNNKPIYKVN